MSQPSPSKTTVPPRSPKHVRERRIRRSTVLTSELLKITSNPVLAPDTLSSSTTSLSSSTTTTRSPPPRHGGVKRKRHSSRLFSPEGMAAALAEGDGQAEGAVKSVILNSVGAKPAPASKKRRQQLPDDENNAPVTPINLTTQFNAAAAAASAAASLLDLPFTLDQGFAVVVLPGDQEASLFPLDEPCSYDQQLQFFSPSGTPVKRQTPFKTVFRDGVLARHLQSGAVCRLRQLRTLSGGGTAGDGVGLRNSALVYSPDGSPAAVAGAGADGADGAVSGSSSSPPLSMMSYPSPMVAHARISATPTSTSSAAAAVANQSSLPSFLLMADDEQFWFQYFRRELGRQPEISASSVSAADLCMTEQQKRAAEKMAPTNNNNNNNSAPTNPHGGVGGGGGRQKFSRRNFFVRVRGSADPEADDGLWIVKMNPDVRNSKVEFKINHVLRTKQVHPVFHTAKYAWTGQQSAVDPRPYHFVACKFVENAVPATRFLEFLNTVSLSASSSAAVKSSSSSSKGKARKRNQGTATNPVVPDAWKPVLVQTGAHPDQLLVDGIVQILEAFACVDPHLVLTGDRVSLWHRDLKLDAVLIQPQPAAAPGRRPSLSWKVLDFGLSELHHINDEGFYEKVFHSVGQSAPTGSWREEVHSVLARLAEPVRAKPLRRKLTDALTLFRDGKKQADLVLREIQQLLLQTK